MQSETALSPNRQLKGLNTSAAQKQTGIYSELRWSCRSCKRVQCLANGLGSEELQRLHQSGKKSLRFSQKEHLFTAGGSFDAVFIVVSGIVKVYRLKQNGEEQILQFCLPGDLVTIDPIYSRNHSSSAVVLDGADICKIPLNLFRAFNPRMPNLQSGLIRQLTNQLSQAQHHAVVLGTKDVEQKLALFLIDLLNRMTALGYPKLELRLFMSQSEIGNYLNVTKETVCRKLAKFESMGIMSMTRRQIKILDRHQLELLGLGSR